MTEQRILDFIDGKLGGSEEEELLHTLALSPERRSLLKQHLKLKDAVSSLSTNAALTVPAATTARLFDRLSNEGFSGAVPLPGIPTSFVPAASGVAPAAATGIFSSSLLSGKAVIYAAGIVAAFLLGVWLNSSSANRDQHLANLSAQSAAPTSDSRATGSPEEIKSSPALSGMAATTHKLHSYSTGSGVPTRTKSNYNGVASNEHHVNEGSFNDQNHPTEFSHEDISQVIPTSASIGSGNTGVQDGKFGSSVANLQLPSARAFAIAAMKQNIRPFDESLRDNAVDYPFSVAMRTAAGPGPTLGLRYINSLSEAKLSYKAASWLSLKVSLGELESYETQAVNRGRSAGVTIIATQPGLNFNTIGSFELGLDHTFFGIPMELAGGIGADQSGLLYPRASLFGSIALTSGLKLDLGVEGLTYLHDVTSSVRAKEQSLIGNNPAVLQHISSERLGFFGPSLQFSWQP